MRELNKMLKYESGKFDMYFVLKPLVNDVVNFWYPDAESFDCYYDGWAAVLEVWRSSGRFNRHVTSVFN